MSKVLFKINTPLSVYRPIDSRMVNDIRKFAWKCGLETCANNLYLPVMSCDDKCNWHDYKPDETKISVSIDGLKATEHGIGLKLKPYTYLNSCQKRYSSLPCMQYESIIYLTRSTNTENVNMHQVFDKKLVLDSECHCDNLHPLSETVIEEVIPEDVDPEIWEYMTPSQKRLW